MKKAFLFILVLMGIMMFLFTSQSIAFDTVKCGDESEFTVYGFLRNNLGVFTQTQEEAQNGNQLATARTWLRVYGDYKVSDKLRFWTAIQGVYEPWYKVEQGAGVPENGGTQIHRRSGWKTYSEFDDINDVIREAYVSWTPTKDHNIRFGRQIAIWGEALTSRVGDVIHPDDVRWGFAFANLEDTRIPQYMVRAIHGIPSIASSFEWIVQPLLLQSEYSVNRLPYPASLGGGYPQRFAPYSEQRVDPPFAFGSGYPAWPLTSTFVNIPGVGPFPMFGVPNVHRTTYPDGFEDTRFGFRTSTVFSGYSFGLMYWHTQWTGVPLIERGATHGVAIPAGALGPGFPPFNVPYQDYDLTYPTMDYIGFYMNKQLPWPGVIRAEVMYSPNMPFNTFNIGPYENGIVRRDNLKYMIAYDLTGYFMPQWHPTDAINVSLEHIGEWTPNSSDLQATNAQGVYATKQPNYHAAFNVHIWTSWLYNKVTTDLIVGYDTWGNSGIVMPSVKYTFPWLNEKLSAELKYIGIYGDNKYTNMGTFKGKDMVLLTTQFNF
jgi:hypothetical protein